MKKRTKAHILLRESGAGAVMFCGANAPVLKRTPRLALRENDVTCCTCRKIGGLGRRKKATE